MPSGLSSSCGGRSISPRGILTQAQADALLVPGNALLLSVTRPRRSVAPEGIGQARTARGHFLRRLRRILIENARRKQSAVNLSSRIVSPTRDRARVTPRPEAGQCHAEEVFLKTCRRTGAGQGAEGGASRSSRTCRPWINPRKKRRLRRPVAR